MKQRKWFWGIFFILSAVFVIASQITDFVKIGVWSILGAILLLAILIDSIPRRNFFGIFIPLALIYEIFWQPLHLVKISVWLLLAAAVLAGIGFSLLFRPRPPRWMPKKGHGHGDRFQQTCDTTDDNNPSAKVSFGACTKYLQSPALRSGQLYTSFGSLEVYLDQAQLSPEGAEFYIDCRFSSVKLYVPRFWKVESHLQTFLGSADIRDSGSPISSDAPCLTLSGNVSFGSVEIQYV